MRINLNQRNVIEPIEWQPYTGETITVRTILRKGQKIIETAFYEDKVKATPKGNAYCIGNGPSRKGFDLSLLKSTGCLLYTSPSPRDQRGSRMPSSA